MECLPLNVGFLKIILELPTFPEENFNIPLYLSKVYEIIHAVFIFKSATLKN
jgi:hypothetical protein